MSSDGAMRLDTVTDDRSALLLMDFQVGVGDQPWAQTAVANARLALTAARERQMLVVYTKVAFAPDYLDVSPSSKAFWPYRQGDLLRPEASRLVDEFEPAAGEPVVEKNRFSPFAGSRLGSILRSQRVSKVVLAGVSTSGVVLAAFTMGENLDLGMTLLSDACADPDGDLHDSLAGRLFPRSAETVAAADWAAGTARVARP
ncbi:cysteine hydrolase [Mycobacterium yunnanensis]|uniref:Cysteine hydrolase n=1 Tax=Mycobacterium yunnanensis TaxID=368477 RepID=A0A9X3BWN0_9MYCO|nr:cysteine hydrolase [Mycobacterium yunnanensis]MCV7424505.1 cysteine hydrolase [Mycobacterium yunnanensis]